MLLRGRHIGRTHLACLRLSFSRYEDDNGQLRLIVEGADLLDNHIRHPCISHIVISSQGEWRALILRLMLNFRAYLQKLMKEFRAPHIRILELDPKGLPMIGYKLHIDAFTDIIDMKFIYRDGRCHSGERALG